MFELRAMLDQFGGNPAETLLYRAITTSRFGHEREAISQFRAFLSTKPAPEMERKARYELSSALTRLGDYGQAANELVAALRLTANGDVGRADSENVRVLLQSLSGVATQTVEFGPAVRVQARRNELGIWGIPVEIDSQRGEWLLDTGANFSTVTESEARRDSDAKPPQVPSNLFFDGLNPIVQVVHSGHNLQMMLDTGASVTSLYPSIRDALAQWERYQLTSTRAEGFAGAGGAEQREADLVPTIQLEVLGRAVYLQRIGLLRKAPAGNAGLRDGILGIDALAGGFRLDFRAMQFTLQ